MKASYNKLQEYFNKKLPEPSKIAELLTFHSYEVEGVEETGGDYIFDIDVLPNRAGDSSDEAGVARELSAILNIPLGGLASKWDVSGEDLRNTSVSVSEINKLLGSDIPAKEIENIFRRLGFGSVLNADEFTVSVPSDRMDLKVKADLVEEVGRIYGYENIKATLPEKAEKTPRVNKKFYYANKIKNFLADEGFSEVYTYSFRDNGEVEIEKPFASDKNFLRVNLRTGLDSALKQNIKNIPLLDGDDIKIFEIGNVFSKGKEYTSLGIGYQNNTDIVDKLSEFLGIEIDGETKENIFETNFDALLEKLPEPSNSYDQIEKTKDVTFNPISPYPFVLRDIAVWVPKDNTSDDVLNIIRQEAGTLLVNTKLFDAFSKDDKISYAFNLVFQSQEKTLSDVEVNKVMNIIIKALNANTDWQARD